MRWPVSREWLDEVRAERDAERTRHAVEIERIHALYGRMLEQQATAQNLAIEQLMNMIQFGQPKPAEAIVESREPDAGERVARRVTEETVARAVERLREEYQKIGVQVPDSELETEARGLMTGGRWAPPSTIIPLLRD